MGGLDRRNLSHSVDISEKKYKLAVGITYRVLAGLTEASARHPLYGRPGQRCRSCQNSAAQQRGSRWKRVTRRWRERRKGSLSLICSRLPRVVQRLPFIWQ